MENNTNTESYFDNFFNTFLENEDKKYIKLVSTSISGNEFVRKIEKHENGFIKDSITYDNNETEYKLYDSGLSLVEIMHTDGSWAKFKYDKFGNAYCREYSDGKIDIEEYEYNELMQVIHEVHKIGYVNKETNEYEYSDNIFEIWREFTEDGKLLSERNSLGKYIIKEYDDHGRLTSKKISDGICMVYEYNDHGDIVLMQRYLSDKLVDDKKFEYGYEE